MNAPAEFHKIFILFDQDSLVTPLKQVTYSMVAVIEINRLGGIEPLHKFSEIGSRGHQKEVKMIPHQDITMQIYPIKLEVV